ncbi:MAG TPA: hypothetical protein VF209_02080 [Patescibacteria group bacterium]
MNKINHLQTRSINAAKTQDWPTAIQTNQEILAIEPANIGALNRLGVALLQTGDTKNAQLQFEKVLQLDKSNTIAKKQLEHIKSKRIPSLTFAREHFIEEPGKTKVVELHRLANKDVLEELSLGDGCVLKSKNRYISVESNRGYVGALPEDLSFRLTKLMNSGNTYECYIHSVNGASCSVYLKETKRSKKNEHINSFPLSKASMSNLADLDDRFSLEEEVPVNIVETDTDEEKTLDDVSPASED